MTRKRRAFSAAFKARMALPQLEATTELAAKSRAYLTPGVGRGCAGVYCRPTVWPEQALRTRISETTPPSDE